MSLLCYLVNSLLLSGYRSKYKRFMATTSVAEVQEKKLTEIISKNSGSHFGLSHGFAGIASISDFQRRVPLSSYEDYAPAIDKIVNTLEPVLYSEKTLLLEKSSGSSAGFKLIPYTAGLKEEFDWGISPWYYNMYTAYPQLKWGKSYWSISPAGDTKEYTPSGIPIGFDSDSGYLGRLAGLLQSFLFAVPNNVAKFTDMEDFRRITSRRLLACRGLSFVSVWNPTFFLVLLDYMTDNATDLTDDPSLRQLLERRQYSKLWPKLKLISCWASAHAGQYAQELSAFFPDAVMQPKGLLATECFVSFPLAGEVGARLSVYSHFFEFIDTDTGEIRLAHQLENCHTYTVVVTTSGGLYRYQLGDIIQVLATDIIPRIEFIGRSDKVSDRFGEKLSEAFVGSAIKQLLATQNTSYRFCMLAPEGNRYILYLQSDSPVSGLDGALRENYHYDYCRRLNQLAPAEVFYLTGDPESDYLNECVRLGQKLGDIKPTPLHLRDGWSNVFTGGFSL